MRQGGTVSPASTHAVFPHLQRYRPVFGAFWPDLTVMRLSTSLLGVVDQDHRRKDLRRSGTDRCSGGRRWGPDHGSEAEMPRSGP